MTLSEAMELVEPDSDDCEAWRGEFLSCLTRCRAQGLGPVHAHLSCSPASSPRRTSPPNPHERPLKTHLGVESSPSFLKRGSQRAERTSANVAELQVSGDVEIQALTKVYRSRLRSPRIAKSTPPAVVV